jgi:hypothetical protein
MNTRPYVLLVLTICLLAACTGCKTVEVSYDPGVASPPTLPCPVELSLSNEFTNYVGGNSDVILAGEKVHASYGPALQKYAIYVAQSVFGDVQVLDGQPPRSDAKLLLVPRVTGSRLEPPVGNVRITTGDLGVHWDFNDPKTGQTLFSTQIQSEFAYSHIRFSAHFPDVIDGLMTNLTSLTIQRFKASKDIQRLSGH